MAIAICIVITTYVIDTIVEHLRVKP